MSSYPKPPWLNVLPGGFFMFSKSEKMPGELNQTKKLVGINACCGISVLCSSISELFVTPLELVTTALMPKSDI